MKTARLLSTVAAVVLLTAGAASAQSPDKDKAATPAPAAQQKAPAEKQGPAMHSDPGMKADEGKSTQNKADTKHETIGQAPKSSDADKSPAAASGTKSEPNAVKATDKSSEAPKSTDVHKSESKTDTKTDTKATQSNDSKQPAATTGQGAAAGSAKLSTEQRTRISTVIKQQKVERIAPSKLNISISVGTRVPATVHFYPLPTEVITIYPEWRGYDYILVGDEIIVVDPRTHEIVAILEA